MECVDCEAVFLAVALIVAGVQTCSNSEKVSSYFELRLSSAIWIFIYHLVCNSFISVNNFVLLRTMLLWVEFWSLNWDCCRGTLCAGSSYVSDELSLFRLFNFCSYYCFHLIIRVTFHHAFFTSSAVIELPSSFLNSSLEEPNTGCIITAYVSTTLPVQSFSVRWPLLDV